ncbi:hypothetical protein [Ornithinimicrobium sp. INDO-MA30-4]|uniref:hypothetical protein n=1 Tax=Ornithinimicrobium sp. INDO-MA30-4 TaxID=2908651 RepID=UPI001F45361F|nr:hypothetical protein [Ornithinimicrobium sp. INDO-MA30-4]UJH71813.1 hypothetical protein L0A91_16555 [Ornithinimicrobium sp. INDO-MA30-4]
MPNIFDNLTDPTRLGPALRTPWTSSTAWTWRPGTSTYAGGPTLPTSWTKRKRRGGPPTARVLVGMVAPADSQQLLDMLQDDVQPPSTGPASTTWRAIARRDRLVAHLRTQLMRGLATREGQQTLQTLKRQLEQGTVAMKVFTEKPLHGKTYIFHAPGKKHGSRWGTSGPPISPGRG